MLRAVFFDAGPLGLVTQVVNFGLPPPEFVAATVNVRHTARFVPADVWQNITP